MNIVKGLMTGTEYDDDLPSGRIRFAIEAARHFERTEGLQLDMGTYRSKDDEFCLACFGGAAYCAANGLASPETFQPQRSSFSSDLEHFGLNRYEDSLDDVRMEGLEQYLEAFGKRPSDYDLPNDTSIHLYGIDPEGFYEDVATLAVLLESKGL